MIKTMTTFMYISTILAVASTIPVCVNYMMKARSYAIDYDTVNDHIKTCRVASLIFTFLAWLANSFEEKSICLKGYLELSKVCSRIGSCWIIYAFACVVVCIIMVSLKKDKMLVNNITKFRNSGFVMGAVFLIVSFLLNV